MHKGMPKTSTIDEPSSLTVSGKTTKTEFVIFLLLQEAEDRICGKFPEQLLLPGWESDEHYMSP
jgi:hypothetical protein